MRGSFFANRGSVPPPFNLQPRSHDMRGWIWDRSPAPAKLEIHEVPTAVPKMAEETSSVSKVYRLLIHFSRDLIELEIVLTCTLMFETLGLLSDQEIYPAFSKKTSGRFVQFILE